MEFADSVNHHVTIGGEVLPLQLSVSDELFLHIFGNEGKLLSLSTEEDKKKIGVHIIGSIICRKIGTASRAMTKKGSVQHSLKRSWLLQNWEDPK